MIDILIFVVVWYFTGLCITIYEIRDYPFLTLDDMLGILFGSAAGPILFLFKFADWANKNGEKIVLHRGKQVKTKKRKKKKKEKTEYGDGML